MERRPRLVGLVIGLGLAVLLSAPARADSERLRLTVDLARTATRFHSLEADTSGLSMITALSGGTGLDFRVFDAPMAKLSQPPALHVTAGIQSDERILGPYLAGQPLIREPILALRSGVHLLLPLEIAGPNAGVAFRVGWQGAFVLGRTGGSEFLTVSKARFGFERTAGWLAGSVVDVGMGRDETFGRDAASKRWDVHVALQGRLIAAPSGAGTKAGRAPPAAADARRSLLWAFADTDVDTDGGIGPDGLQARVGLGLDVAGLLPALFAPTSR
jgi:hypothetical protein